MAERKEGRKTDKYEKLTEQEHVLKRPSRYLGSTTPERKELYIPDDRGSFIKKEVEYSPAFIKIFDEILSNSIDEHRREGSSLTRIDVLVDRESGSIRVKDDGGIPVEEHPQHKEWIPQMIFSNLRAGSNFDDDEKRKGAGTHGEGSTLTNIMSRRFEVRTCDGKKEFYIVFKENMGSVEGPYIKNKKRKSGHTDILFYPDLPRFYMEGIDDDAFSLLRKKCYDASVCNPELKVRFNDEEITLRDIRSLAKKVTQHVVFERSGPWEVAVGISNDGFHSMSFVNSMETSDGGTHEDHVLQGIVRSLKAMIEKRYKITVRPSDIKEHLFLFINCTISNPSFNSQTKEKLITGVKAFDEKFEPSDKFIKRIYDSEILNSVIDRVQRKKRIEEEREAQRLNRDIKRSKVLKLVDAKKKRKRGDCVLGVFEGESALGPVKQYRDAQTFGAYPLKGKFINVLSNSRDKVLNNQEVQDLMAALGLEIDKDPEGLRYGKVFIYTDADPDGDAISSLLINFFFRFWPSMFEKGMVHRVLTPLLVARKGKKEKYFYTDEGFRRWYSGLKDQGSWDVQYKKGLGALKDKEYDMIINDPYCVRIEKDEASERTLEDWFKNDPRKRKEKILKKDG